MNFRKLLPNTFSGFLAFALVIYLFTILIPLAFGGIGNISVPTDKKELHINLEVEQDDNLIFKDEVDLEHTYYIKEVKLNSYFDSQTLSLFNSPKSVQVKSQIYEGTILQDSKTIQFGDLGGFTDSKTDSIKYVLDLGYYKHKLELTYFIDGEKQTKSYIEYIEVK